MKGNLLLENAYGIIDEIPGDGLIVYKSGTVCGILRADGSFKQISAPKVERIYAGG
ncbi:MAG: hypothetical protein FWF08_06410 [Oscillospiraceae bacterium]|nr:hypothetical protein [Oscillospiraceae bacterium]